MAALVTTVLAVVLAALLGIVGLFYGGSRLTQSSADASAARILNTSSQVVSAVDLYTTDNSGIYPAAPQDLVTSGYLKQLPDNTDWTFGNGYIQRTGLTQSECDAVNAKLNVSGAPPSCSSTGTTFVGCCSAP